MCHQLQLAHISLDAGFMNEIGSIHLHPGEIEFIHHHLIAEEWKQLHIYNHLLDVGNSILFISQSKISAVLQRIDRLQYLHAFHSQFERENELYMLNRNIHARRF